MIDKLYPVQPSEHLAAAPRRLPPFWLWTTRILWVATFLIMAALNIAAIVAHVERNASGMTGGAAGLRTISNGNEWTLVVDPTGPGAAEGIATGDQLQAINGEEIAPDASYQQVNRQLFGAIGDPLTITVQGSDGAVREVTLTLISEDALQIRRRWRVPLAIEGGYLPTIEAVLLVGYLLTSALIFWKRTDDWLALYLTLTLVLITPQLSYSWYFLGQSSPYWDYIFRVIIAIGITLTLPNFFLLPNGHLVPRWTVVLAFLWVIFGIATELFRDSPYSFYHLAGAAQLLIWLGWFATGMLAQAYRYRYQATATEQQQIKWVAFGLSVAVLVNLGWILAFELFPVLNFPGPAHQWMWLIGRTIYVVGMMTLPIAFGIAVFRYRLWHIDNVINRTLVYGVLTAIIVGVYIVVVSVLNVIFTSGQVLSQIIAIALNLIIFEPLRDRLQSGVDRLMFGESDDLAEVMKGLKQRLSAAVGPEAVLPTIVETMADSLKSPYVAISLPEGDTFQIAASTGTPTAAYFIWPLVYHREVVGHLILGARAVEEPYKAHEWELVENASYHVSAAVYDIMLEHELTRRKVESSKVE